MACLLHKQAPVCLHRPLFCFETQEDGVLRTFQQGWGLSTACKLHPAGHMAVLRTGCRWVDCALVRATASFPAAKHNRAGALEQFLCCVCCVLCWYVCVLRALCVVAIASSLFCVTRRYLNCRQDAGHTHRK